MQWSRSTKTWTTRTGFLNLIPLLGGNRARWGAIFASQDGYLYGSENASGQLFRFPLPPGTSATMVGTSAASSNNDGARCVKAA
ncbi:hypothetical protein F4779DRAFT_559659 [Xylariaceae sp. FL0662B]|nr:hypothetical protein F4779DRAFT_559659 [Xylariaceae sp. FL0662B]